MSKRADKPDAANDVNLNPVQLPDGTIVPWGAVFERLSDEGMRRARPEHD